MKSATTRRKNKRRKFTDGNANIEAAVQNSLTKESLQENTSQCGDTTSSATGQESSCVQSGDPAPTPAQGQQNGGSVPEGTTETAGTDKKAAEEAAPVLPEIMKLLIKAGALVPDPKDVDAAATLLESTDAICQVRDFPQETEKLTGDERDAFFRGMQRVNACNLEKKGNNDSRYFCLSGIALVFFVAFCMSRVTANEGRRILAVLAKLLPQKEMSRATLKRYAREKAAGRPDRTPKCVGLIHRLMGYTAERIKTGMSELRQYGLFGNLENAHAPGAGRPPVDAGFSLASRAYCTVLGISEKDIRRRKDDRSLNKAMMFLRKKPETSKDVQVKEGSKDVPASKGAEDAAKFPTSVDPANAAAAVTPGDTAPADPTASAAPASASDPANDKDHSHMYRRLNLSYEEVVQKHEEVRGLAGKIRKRVNEELDPRHRDPHERHFLEELISLMTEETDHVEKKLLELSADPSCRLAHQEGASLYDPVEAVLSGTIFTTVLTVILETLEDLGQAVLEKWNGMGPDEGPSAVIWHLKHDTVKLKNCRKDIRDGWEAYGIFQLLRTKGEEFLNSLGKKGPAAGMRIISPEAFHADAKELLNELGILIQHLEEASPSPEEQTDISGTDAGVQDDLPVGPETAPDAEPQAGQTEQKKHRKRTIPEALKYLRDLLAFIREKDQSWNPEEDSDTLPVLAVLVELMRLKLLAWKIDWKGDLGKGNTEYHASCRIAQSLFCDSFQDILTRLRGEYDLIVKNRNRNAGNTEDTGKAAITTDTGESETASDAEGISSEAVTGSVGDTGSAAPTEAQSVQPDQKGDTSKTTTLSAARAKAQEGSRIQLEQFISQCREYISFLREHLSAGIANKTGKEKGKRAKNGTAAPEGSPEEILGRALAVLDTLSARIDELQNAMDDPRLLPAARDAAAGFLALLQFRIKKIEKIEGVQRKKGPHRMTCCEALKVCEVIAGKGFDKNVRGAWVLYDSALQHARSVANGGVPEHYVDSIAPESPEFWFREEQHLYTEKRLAVYWALWEAGKDPTDITDWLALIVEHDFLTNFGDPTEDCRCTAYKEKQIQNAFLYFTGYRCSGKTLMAILFDRMKYSRRQHAKLEQSGPAHPQRDEQIRYIQGIVDAADRAKTLILSIDTKAAIKLGRFRHDNTTIICSPNGVYRVCDHDFPPTMRDIYPNGTKLVGEERMDERAVLHPVGVYCLNNNKGHVALVLGTETPESMCNLLRTVILEAQEEMPELEKVVILADGGGVNSSNGIQWKDQLRLLSDDCGLPLEVHHFPPGASKHNKIEHMCWSYISLSMRGRPLLDIEHVLGYFESTTTLEGLIVKCWFDRKRYLTVEEKRAAGIPVLTQAQLQQRAGNRIEYTFPEEKGDMHKWNYTIHPSVRLEQTA